MSWRAVARRVKDQVYRENLSILAAGVAYYGLLAIFPAAAAVVALYGLVGDPARIQAQLASFSHILPSSTIGIIDQQLHSLAATSKGQLSIGFGVALAVSLYSATQGVSALITALNIAYHRQECRGLLRFYGTVLALTTGAVVFTVVALLLIVAVPAILNFTRTLGIGEVVRMAIDVLRWPLLAVVMALALSTLFRYAPDREPPRWRWLSGGAVVGTVLWLIGSIAFSVYVSNFGNYNKTYGSIAAVVVLLVWFYVTAYIILIAAKIDAEIGRERRAADAGSHSSPR